MKRLGLAAIVLLAVAPAAGATKPTKAQDGHIQDATFAIVLAAPADFDDVSVASFNRDCRKTRRRRRVLSCVLRVRTVEADERARCRIRMNVSSRTWRLTRSTCWWLMVRPAA